MDHLRAIFFKSLTLEDVDNFYSNLKIVHVTKCCLQQRNKFVDIPYVFLKPLQYKCLRIAFCESRDILACLPTSYGKSLVYQLLPYLDKVKGTVAPVVLIVEPINAIIYEQLSKLPNVIKAEDNEATVTQLKTTHMNLNLLLDFPKFLLLETLLSAWSSTETE